jgi:hypothetical protein
LVSNAVGLRWIDCRPRIGAAAKRLARSRIGRGPRPYLLRDALVAVRHTAAMVHVVPPVVVAGNVRAIEVVVL